MSDYTDEFVAEATENLTTLENALLTLESDPEDDEAMDAVFRTAHTLKGNSSAMGFEGLAELAHAIEDLLDAVRHGDIEVTPSRMDLIFEAVDEIDAGIERIRETGDPAVDAGELESDLRDAIESDPDDGADQGQQGQRAQQSQQDQQSQQGQQAQQAQQSQQAQQPQQAQQAQQAAGGTSESGGGGGAAADDGANASAGGADSAASGSEADDSDLVRATINTSGGPMPGADALLVLEAAQRVFELVAAKPDTDTLERGDYSDSFELYLRDATADRASSYLGAVSAVDDVDVTRVEAVGPEATRTAPEEPPMPEVRGGDDAAEADADGSAAATGGAETNGGAAANVGAAANGGAASDAGTPPGSGDGAPSPSEPSGPAIEPSGAEAADASADAEAQEAGGQSADAGGGLQMQVDSAEDAEADDDPLDELFEADDPGADVEGIDDEPVVTDDADANAGGESAGSPSEPASGDLQQSTQTEQSAEAHQAQQQAGAQQSTQTEQPAETQQPQQAQRAKQSAQTKPPAEAQQPQQSVDTQQPQQAQQPQQQAKTEQSTGAQAAANADDAGSAGASNGTEPAESPGATGGTEAGTPTGATDDVTPEESPGDATPEESEDTEASGEDQDDLDDDSDDSRAGPSGSSGVDSVDSVRVDVDQLDDLHGLVEQLVTSRIKLRRAVEDGQEDAALDTLNELDKITDNLQSTVMDVRLIPLSKVTGRFPRMVRDLARETGKKIDFEMEGTDVELDRRVLTQISDPLLHILRNSIDHGVEPPDEREAAGKSRQGSVVLSAEQERDHVIIEVSDDGRGLDAEQIREKAVEQGIRSATELESMSDEEIYDLIFHPGFSTNDEVTDLSGRGVGMDVVHETVSGLDGTVDVASTPGEGTTVRLRLPVTVAIVQVLFVRVANRQFGVPIKNIDEVSRARDLHSVRERPVVEHGDALYPVVALDDALDVENASEAADIGNGMLLRIRASKRRVALHCDSVIDQEEVVVKPLEGVLAGTSGVSGTAVLGDGQVVPILDVVTL